MPAKRPVRPDHQPSLFAEEFVLPADVAGVVPVDPEVAVAGVASGGHPGDAPAYVSFAQPDDIIERVYRRYDRLKNATGCKTRRRRTLSR